MKAHSLGQQASYRTSLPFLVPSFLLPYLIGYGKRNISLPLQKAIAIFCIITYWKHTMRERGTSHSESRDLIITANI
jgi:hypothetical protein